MIIVKGHEVAFKLKGLGQPIYCPRSYGMLHDPSGGAWPRNSILVIAFRREGKEARLSTEIEEYFGQDYLPRRGSVDLPVRRLSEWDHLGDVEAIDYSRVGEHADDYVHHFKQTEWWNFSEITPQLYRRGRAWRLELPEGAKLNWRGFIWP
jgi:hypothetical protein